MASAEGGEVREREKAATPLSEAGARAGEGDAVTRGPPLSGTSYWLDMWLLLLFDLALFVFVYLLP